MPEPVQIRNRGGPLLILRQAGIRLPEAAFSVPQLQRGHRLIFTHPLMCTSGLPFPFTSAIDRRCG
jgi:hypothetical protein